MIPYPLLSRTLVLVLGSAALCDFGLLNRWPSQQIEENVRRAHPEGPRRAGTGRLAHLPMAWRRRRA